MLRKLPRTEVAAIVLSIAVVCGAAVERLRMPRAVHSEPYHASVRAAFAQVPERIGDWTGRDTPVPNEATNQLRPNLIISRQYTNAMTGRSIAFLLVQCADVRDIVPHYPPMCYPGRGLTVAGTEQRTYDVEGLQINATQYEFDSNTFRQAQALSVVNFMLLPTGEVLPDMDLVREQIALKNRYFGAAQVQVVMDAGWTQGDRDAAVRQIVRGYRPVLDAVLAGVGR